MKPWYPHSLVEGWSVTTAVVSCLFSLVCSVPSGTSLTGGSLHSHFLCTHCFLVMRFLVTVAATCALQLCFWQSFHLECLLGQANTLQKPQQLIFDLGNWSIIIGTREASSSMADYPSMQYLQQHVSNLANLGTLSVVSPHHEFIAKQGSYFY